MQNIFTNMAGWVPGGLLAASVLAISLWLFPANYVATLVNNSDPAVTVTEYVMDQPAPFTLQGTVTRVPVRVPASDVRIYSLETTAR